MLALASLSTFDEGLDLARAGSTERVRELEGPEEAVNDEQRR